MPKEYRTIAEVSGPYVKLKDVFGVSYNEMAELELKSGERRRAVVSEIRGGDVFLTVFDETDGINPSETKVRFLSKDLQIPVSSDMQGRVFDSLAKPIDGKASILPEKRLSINGCFLNPLELDTEKNPLNFKAYGESNINSGESLAVFVSSSFEGIKFLSEIAKEKKDMLLVFASAGLSFEEVNYFKKSLSPDGSINRAVIFENLAGDSYAQRTAILKTAMTTAEFFAFEKGLDVLLLASDLSYYADSLRIMSSYKKEKSGKGGYPVSLEADFASVFNRVGKKNDKKGSLTFISSATISESGLNNPVASAIGKAADRTVVISPNSFLDKERGAKVKEKLFFLKKSYELLKEKELKLKKEYIALFEREEELKEQLEDYENEAKRSLSLAELSMTKEELRLSLIAVSEKLGFDFFSFEVISEKNEDELEAVDKNSLYSYGLAFSSPDLDKCISSVYKLLPLKIKHREAQNELNEVSAELKKLKRRVNTLRLILIPDCEEAVRRV